VSAVGVIRVLVVDDDPFVRAGLSDLVATDDGLELVGEAADGREAVDHARRHRTDVALVDIRMPVMDGIAATSALRVLPHPPSVAVLTTFDLDEYVFAALRAGASGFLLKDVPPADLLTGIRAVAAGDAMVAPAVTRRLIDAFAGHLPDPATGRGGAAAAMAPLTDREREVLVEVARGRSNAEIAGELSVSEATVKTHIGRILGKLGLRDRVQVVVFAYEHGIVRPHG